MQLIGKILFVNSLTGYYYYYYYYYFLPSGVKIPKVKSKVKSKRKAEVVTPRR